MTPRLNDRYDFVFMVDCSWGIMSADPDMGGMPFLDDETGRATASNSMLNRIVRDHIQARFQGKEGYRLFVERRGVLNRLIQKACDDEGIPLGDAPKDVADGGKRVKPGVCQGSEVDRVVRRMCAEYFDIRMFGAVLSTGPLSGSVQLTGPIQSGTGVTVDPVYIQERTPTRVAVTTEKESEDQGGQNRMMGCRFQVPYAVYVFRGSIDPQAAAKTGMTQEDLDLYWDALEHGFSGTRSTQRGVLTPRKLVVFRHTNPMGNGRSFDMYDRVRIARKDGSKPAREWSDYAVTVDTGNLPAGIRVEERF